MSLTQTQVSKLFITVLGRAPEGDGSLYFQNKTDAISTVNEMLGYDVVKSYLF